MYLYYRLFSFIKLSNKSKIKKSNTKIARKFFIEFFMSLSAISTKTPIKPTKIRTILISLEITFVLFFYIIIWIALLFLYTIQVTLKNTSNICTFFYTSIILFKKPVNKYMKDKLINVCIIITLSINNTQSNYTIFFAFSRV